MRMEGDHLLTGWGDMGSRLLPDPVDGEVESPRQVIRAEEKGCVYPQLRLEEPDEQGEIMPAPHPLLSQARRGGEGHCEAVCAHGEGVEGAVLELNVIPEDEQVPLFASESNKMPTQDKMPHVSLVTSDPPATNHISPVTPYSGMVPTVPPKDNQIPSVPPDSNQTTPAPSDLCQLLTLPSESKLITFVSPESTPMSLEHSDSNHMPCLSSDSNKIPPDKNQMLQISSDSSQVPSLLSETNPLSSVNLECKLMSPVTSNLLSESNEMPSELNQTPYVSPDSSQMFTVPGESNQVTSVTVESNPTSPVHANSNNMICLPSESNQIPPDSRQVSAVPCETNQMTSAPAESNPMPLVYSDSNHMPHVPPDSNQMPHVPPDSNQMPHVPPDSNQMPHVHLDSNQMPNVHLDSNQMPNVHHDSNQIPFISPDTNQIPPDTSDSIHQPFVPCESNNVPIAPESNQRPHQLLASTQMLLFTPESNSKSTLILDCYQVPHSPYESNQSNELPHVALEFNQAPHVPATLEQVPLISLKYIPSVTPEANHMTNIYSESSQVFCSFSEFNQLTSKLFESNQRSPHTVTTSEYLQMSTSETCYTSKADDKTHTPVCFPLEADHITIPYEMHSKSPTINRCRTECSVEDYHIPPLPVCLSFELEPPNNALKEFKQEPKGQINFNNEAELTPLPQINLFPKEDQNSCSNKLTSETDLFCRTEQIPISSHSSLKSDLAPLTETNRSLLSESETRCVPHSRDSIDLVIDQKSSPDLNIYKKKDLLSPSTNNISPEIDQPGLPESCLPYDSSQLQLSEYNLSPGTARIPVTETCTDCISLSKSCLPVETDQLCSSKCSMPQDHDRLPVSESCFFDKTELFPLQEPCLSSKTEQLPITENSFYPENDPLPEMYFLPETELSISDSYWDSSIKQAPMSISCLPLETEALTLNETCFPLKSQLQTEICLIAETENSHFSESILPPGTSKLPLDKLCFTPKKEQLPESNFPMDQLSLFDSILDCDNLPLSNTSLHYEMEQLPHLTWNWAEAPDQMFPSECDLLVNLPTEANKLPLSDPVDPFSIFWLDTDTESEPITNEVDQSLSDELLELSQVFSQLEADQLATLPKTDQDQLCDRIGELTMSLSDFGREQLLEIQEGRPELESPLPQATMQLHFSNVADQMPCSQINVPLANDQKLTACLSDQLCTGYPGKIVESKHLNEVDLKGEMIVSGGSNSELDNWIENEVTDQWPFYNMELFFETDISHELDDVHPCLGNVQNVLDFTVTNKSINPTDLNDNLAISTLDLEDHHLFQSLSELHIGKQPLLISQMETTFENAEMPVTGQICSNSYIDFESHLLTQSLSGLSLSSQAQLNSTLSPRNLPNDTNNLPLIVVTDPLDLSDKTIADTLLLPIGINGPLNQSPVILTIENSEESRSEEGSLNSVQMSSCDIQNSFSVSPKCKHHDSSSLLLPDSTTEASVLHNTDLSDHLSPSHEDPAFDDTLMSPPGSPAQLSHRDSGIEACQLPTCNASDTQQPVDTLISASALSSQWEEGNLILGLPLDTDLAGLGDEVDRLRAVFDALDRDKDGFVKMEDFVQFATVYGAEQVKYLTSYLDPAGLGVINFRDFYRGISEIQNEDLDMQLYDMGYPSEEEPPACSVDFDDIAEFEVTEVTDSAYVGSESAYSECETFTDEDTGTLAAQEDPENEGEVGTSRVRQPATLEGLELSLCDISAVTVTGQEEQFEDFGEGAEPDLFNSNCEEEEPNITQTTSSSQNISPSPDKRTSSRKEARRLHHSSLLGDDPATQQLTDMACDESDLTDKVLYLEERVGELEREATTTGEQQNRLRQENLQLLHRAHALEEQLKDQEVRSDELQSEDTRKHRDEMRKMERDREYRLSSLKARIQELENENMELRSQLPIVKATTQKLEEEKKRLLDQVEELQHQLQEHQQLNKKLEGKLNKERHKQQTDKERSQEVIEELRRELEQMQLMRLEMEHRLGLGNSTALQEYNSRTREAELEQEVRRLKQEHRGLKEQNEELNGQIINLSIQGAKNLFSTTFSDSLAAEISSVSRDELMEAIHKQEEINLRLQDYIDRIIVAIMETNPAILEVKIH
ncbi:rab11 family-interacting protein 3 isoform X2 [Bombina bombina]|uniref:rab11 family-interacting protein 3 isoform X2 n=1 Tax=Bombina bombina TaxID=8345 RepID=UPI00235ABDB7|nr:rab11 family-interacting protein 3 isoform X2 [Bombina bombina]